MNPCTVNTSSSPTFRNHLKDYAKKYKSLTNDLWAEIERIEADYKNACFAARPPGRKVGAGVELWKYSIRCTDLQRSARNGFRVIGVFLDPDCGQKRVMYLIALYWKGDQQEIQDDQVKHAVQYLKAQIASVDSSDTTSHQ